MEQGYVRDMDQESESPEFLAAMRVLCAWRIQNAQTLQEMRRMNTKLRIQAMKGELLEQLPFKVSLRRDD